MVFVSTGSVLAKSYKTFTYGLTNETGTPRDTGSVSVAVAGGRPR